MPNMDGFEVLAAIRQAALPVKVIMLTARQHERDVLRGFAMGADDYVVKPFSPLECQCRYRMPAILPTLPISAAVSLGGDAVGTLQ